MVALVLCVVCAAPVAAARHAGRCDLPKYARITAHSHKAVIFRLVTGHGDERAYGCLTREGRRVRLAYVNDGFPDDYDVPSQFRTAGTFVTWVEDEGDHYGYEARTVHLFDLASRREIFSRGAAVREMGGSGDPRVLALKLDRLGRLVYLAHDRDTPDYSERQELHGRDADGDHLLDSGTGIRRKSVALRHGVVTWSNSGEKRSATLH